MSGADDWCPTCAQRVHPRRSAAWVWWLLPVWWLVGWLGVGFIVGFGSGVMLSGWVGLLAAAVLAPMIAGLVGRSVATPRCPICGTADLRPPPAD